MDVDRIMQALETLPLAELRRIKTTLDGLITTMQAWQDPEPAPHHKTYRQEYVKCNKPVCKVCAAGPGHGPYWYAYWREGGRLRKQYLGKHRREM